MKVPFLRSGFNYDRDEASDESGLACRDVSLAKQEFAEEVDINTIVRRFGLDGALPENVRMPSYGDFTEVTDFQTAMNAVAMANESFDAMPARVRARFENSPEKFVAFCLDEGNREEAEKLGLVAPEVLERRAREAQARVAASAAARAQAAGAGESSAPQAKPAGGKEGAGNPPL